MISKPFRWAIFFLVASAALHILAVIPGGFGDEALMLIPIGIVYLAVAYGLSRGWRWLGYLTFFGLFIGGLVAMSSIWANGAVPSWWYLGIVIANFLCVVCLFAGLWSKPAPSAQTAA